jgi:hypothetical protein
VTELVRPAVWADLLTVREQHALDMMVSLHAAGGKLSPAGANPVANRASCDRLVLLGLADRQPVPGYNRFSYSPTFMGRRVRQLLPKDLPPCLSNAQA